MEEGLSHIFSLFEGADEDDSELAAIANADSAKIIVTREHPMANGSTVHMGTFGMQEFAGDQELPEIIEDLFGGGRYLLRLRVKGAYRKGTYRVNLAGPTHSHDETQRRLAAMRGVEQADQDTAEAEEPEEDVEDQRVYVRRQVPQRGETGWTSPAAPPAEESGTKTLVEAIAAMQTPIVTALLAERNDERRSERISAAKGTPAEQAQLAGMKAQSELMTSMMTSMMGMYSEAAKINAKTQGAVMVDTIKLISKLATQAREGGPETFLEKLPGMIEGLGGLSRPPGPMGPVPQQLQAEPAPHGQSTAPVPGAPPQISTGEEPVNQEEEEAKAFALMHARKFVGLFRFLVRHQPDPTTAWDQTLTPMIDSMSARTRRRIEALGPGAGGEEFASAMLETIDGLEPEEFHEVGKVASAQEGGLDYLGEVWACAPWREEEEEEEEGSDLGDAAGKEV